MLNVSLGRAPELVVPPLAEDLRTMHVAMDGEMETHRAAMEDAVDVGTAMEVGSSFPSVSASSASAHILND